MYISAEQTHFVENSILLPLRARNIRVAKLDGSSDIFTQIAISDWLQSEDNVPVTGECCVLCDEFHMMSRELKEQVHNGLCESVMVY